MQVIRLNMNGKTVPISFKNKDLLLHYLGTRIQAAETNKEPYFHIDFMFVDIPDDIDPSSEEHAIMNALIEKKEQLEDTEV